MYKKIKPNNKIFNSRAFQKDKYKFNIILKNLPSPELELYSDEKNYIICRGAKKYPTWIWTKDNFDNTVIDDIEKLIEMYLTENDKDKFTCKKELYDLLIKRNFKYINKEDYFEMGFLICHKTIKPKKCDGKLFHACNDDKKVIEKYWYEDCKEMNGTTPITKQQAKIDVDGFIKDGKFFVLKNNDGKIVCMAGYGITENQAKIGHVYTPKEERKKGYAANLIYLMTNDLLKKGLVPLLYTDYNYIPSNKAYINAGYEDTGILINFSCSKNIIINEKNKSRKDILNNFYNNDCDEDKRLLSQHGQVEFLTTVRYIDKYLKKNSKILEVGAGTGRYSLYYANKGYNVTSIEYVKHNVEILKSKIKKNMNINVDQGDAIDLSRFKDNTFDVTLVLGPLYHLYDDKDINKAIKEAVRVTKKGGIIMLAYLTNDSIMVDWALMDNHLLDGYPNDFNKDFKLVRYPEGIFAPFYISEFKEIMSKFNVNFLHNVATDGFTRHVRKKIDTLTKKEFDVWMKYHFSTCEREDLQGYSNHMLYICKKMSN